MKKKFLWYQIEESENKKYFKAIRYWLSQGLFYSHNTERIYKVICELFFFFLTACILVHFSGLGEISVIFVSLFTSHNINFIVNCALWETLICDLGYRGAGRENLVSYIKELRSRTSKYSSISCAFLYGGIARGELHDSSDLDVVFVRKPGITNAIVSLYIITMEKLFSLFSRIPLELFLADDISFVQRPMASEKIIIIDDKTKALQNCGREIQTIKEAEILNGLTKTAEQS